MIKKILITSILLISIIYSPVYADNEISITTKNWFNNYSEKISNKLSIDKEISFFNWFNEKLNQLLINKKYNQAQLGLINDLIKLSNDYTFNLELSEKEKNNKLILQTNNLVKKFKYLSYNPDHIFLENWIWYTYIYDKHLVFSEWKNIKPEDLKFNNIFPDKAIAFLLDNNSLWFIVNYKKVKLISDSIIFWIPNKYWFLKEIKDDKKIINSETDNLFNTLKSNTINLTKWKDKPTKIKSIYDYILNNIDYPKTYSLDNANIFSWIDTFKNKSWVCEWYTKIFMYMLNFANINDTEVIRWYVIDAIDFPKVWHAWVRIWNEYFDPTFDDPIWNTKTKLYDDYEYFWLPKDLIYTNRYDFNNLPQYLKEKDKDFLKWFITQNIIPLLPKYKNSWYNILKPYLMKLNNWIDVDKELDIEDLKKIMWYYEVIDMKFTKNWTKNTITNINYYLIDNTDIDDLMVQLNFNIDWYYLFKWKLDNWNYEYRLAYNLVIK